MSLTRVRFKKLILSTWLENGSQWIEIIDNKVIPSKEMSNPAILEAIKNKTPNRFWILVAEKSDCVGN
ncbi:hypothetical protein [Arthrospiribacter ruber]|uniref:DUF5678 domain-containing protein n=1 Tax=Arthrospiribacter ruber TaxID=2487934 RepID=A0A951MAU5_9BACT|nr:hypothetical protein [Arthrospiribacter ruber]MBW3466794.1 hypothetical protein [Arthrospiribacter ruber]MBW3469586.1 hypothetical protein [Arthrospiribacter ruber]MBW3470339.1 hypothetical protein [Arthrospiribacter ruber]